MREVAVSEPRDPLHRGIGVAAHPHRDRALHGQWVQPRAVDAMPASLEVNDLLGPEPAQERDLLLDAPSAVRELLAEGLVLDEVPADADAEAEASAGEDVDLGRLLGDEGGLTLRQHDDRGTELELREGGEPSEEHERLVEERALVVGEAVAAGAVARRAEDVIERDEGAVAQIFDRLDVVAGGRGGPGRLSPEGNDAQPRGPTRSAAP